MGEGSLLSVKIVSQCVNSGLLDEKNKHEITSGWVNSRTLGSLDVRTGTDGAGTLTLEE